jgi:hypothetical protein
MDNFFTWSPQTPSPIVHQGGSRSKIEATLPSVTILDVARMYRDSKRDEVNGESLMQIERSLHMGASALERVGVVQISQVSKHVASDLVSQLQSDFRLADTTCDRVMRTLANAVRLDPQSGRRAWESLVWARRSIDGQPKTPRFQSARDAVVKGICEGKRFFELWPDEKSLLLLATTYGVGPAELARMRVQDVDLEVETVRFTNRIGLQRELKLTKLVLLYLRGVVGQARRMGSDVLWCDGFRPMTPRKISRLIQRAAKSNGTPAVCGELRQAAIERVKAEEPSLYWHFFGLQPKRKAKTSRRSR